MTQPVTEKKRPPLKWIVPIPTNEGGSFGRPSLCAACRGNDVMAVILNYFVYEASTEAEQKKIDTLKVQSIQLKRTHDEILKGIHPSRISKKTLIDHMHKLETWGFLKVDGYHHIYEVFFPAITEAMKTPPPAEKRKPRGRHVSQKVKSTNLQSSEVKSTNHAVKTTNSEDCTLEQISNLQSEMLNLQSEMSKLQFEMLNLTFAQSSQAASQQVLTPLSEAPRLIDCNRLIETSNYVAANAGNDTPSFPFPVLESSLEAVTDETFKVAVMDDWREYKHLPRFTPTIDVMSEVLKRLQRESMYRSQLSTQQANDVDNTNDPHTGQLADSSTVSQARDNDVRAVSDPLSTSERVNTSHDVESSLNASTDTPTKASDHIAAVATCNPDEEEHTPLSRSGESAPDGDGVQQEAPKRIRKKAEKPPLPALTDEERQLRKDVQAWIDGKRGYKLYGRATAKDIHIERQNAWTLAHMLYVRLYEQNEEEGCTWQDLEYTHEYCCKRDKFWSQPDNRVRIGTFAILQKFAVAMALKVQEPIDLEDKRNGVHKQTAMAHGAQTRAYGLVPSEELHKSAWEA